jgi:hypothetical protein
MIRAMQRNFTTGVANIVRMPAMRTRKKKSLVKNEPKRKSPSIFNTRKTLRTIKRTVKPLSLLQKCLGENPGTIFKGNLLNATDSFQG